MANYHKPPSRPGALTTNTVYSQKLTHDTAAQSFHGFEQASHKYSDT